MLTVPRERREEPQAPQQEFKSPKNQALHILQAKYDKMREEFKRKETKWEQKQRDMTHTISQSIEKIQALEQCMEEMKKLDKAEVV